MMLRLLTCLTLLTILSNSAPLRAEYDPLKVDSTTRETQDFTIADSTRSREIPIRVYLPKEPKPAPVVLFSHGLGGARTNNAYLGQHWAQRGYIAVFLQHAGSDENVWREARLGERLSTLREAASPKNFLLRNEDVRVTLDQLDQWNTDKTHPLSGRLDLKHVGMSGHSFGAVTTQAVSGQTPVIGKGFTDDRIRAAVMMSPSGPRRGDPQKAFGGVKIPWMLLTGTEDDSPIGDTTPESRLEVFPGLPPGGKYELVLNGAQHSAFSERGLQGDRKKRNPNHHRAILAMTTTFWDAYLNDDAAAKAWLDGPEAKSVLEKEDRWQRK